MTLYFSKVHEVVAAPVKAGFQRNATHATQATQASTNQEAGSVEFPYAKNKSRLLLSLLSLTILKSTNTNKKHCHIMQQLFAIHNKPIFAVCRLIFILSSADAETAQHVSHWTHSRGCKQWTDVLPLNACRLLYRWTIPIAIAVLSRATRWERRLLPGSVRD